MCNASFVQQDTCAVIVAGGSGQRFGYKDGKQLVDICGFPMLTWSLKAFDLAPSIGAIVVVVAHEKMQKTKERAVDSCDFKTPIYFAEAGETRQESVLSGLLKVPDEFGFVAIHDAARPLVQTSTIEGCLQAFREIDDADGVICGQPAVDTLKIVSNNSVLSTPCRSSYWAVQTPQVFETKKICAIHNWAEEIGYTGTDDASLVEHYGGIVKLFEAPRDNIKVTLPEDLHPVRAILEARLIELGKRSLR